MMHHFPARRMVGLGNPSPACSTSEGLLLLTPQLMLLNAALTNPTNSIPIHLPNCPHLSPRGIAIDTSRRHLSLPATAYPQAAIFASIYAMVNRPSKEREPS
ncbi:MAG: hypothetical protein ACE5GO_03905 [Anaerolineales bacterium]